VRKLLREESKSKSKILHLKYTSKQGEPTLMIKQRADKVLLGVFPSFPEDVHRVQDSMCEAPAVSQLERASETNAVI
jgi:hypothetical protein